MAKRDIAKVDEPTVDKELVKRPKVETPIAEIRNARQLRNALIFQQDNVPQLREGIFMAVLLQCIANNGIRYSSIQGISRLDTLLPR